MPRKQLPTEFYKEEALTITPKTLAKTEEKDEQWLPQEPEGQLSVDVFETEKEMVITTPIAGVKPEDLEIYVSGDLITIRGRREDHYSKTDRNYLFEECYWGAFSRSIILPVHVDTEAAEAVLKSGVLTVTLPKTENKGFLPVQELDDEL